MSIENKDKYTDEEINQQIALIAAKKIQIFDIMEEQDELKERFNIIERERIAEQRKLFDLKNNLSFMRKKNATTS